MPKKISATEMAFATLMAQRDQILGKEPPERATALTTEVGATTVDTVIAFDTKVWETAIRRDSKRWNIVEQYDDEAGAKAGHAKWVKLITEKPNAELPSIVTYE